MRNHILDSSSQSNFNRKIELKQDQCLFYALHSIKSKPTRFIIFVLLLFLSFPQTSYAQSLRINEILADNITGITDSYGDHSDWIEIYNTTNAIINLEGYHLSDKQSNPTKWKFPAVSINPNEFILVFASENTSTDNELHANFKLSSSGEYILLSDANSILIHQLDSVLLQEDISYGYSLESETDLKYFNQPTPASSNTNAGYLGFLSGEPALSLASGFYPDPIDVEITHTDTDAELRYTLDGSEPSADSPLYSASLNFQNRENEANTISLIPTNPGSDYPKDGYDMDRADSRGWIAPSVTINKSNVLKVKAFKTNYLPGNTVTATYFINPETTNRYSLPVLSITTDKDNLFDEEIGIYVYGTTGDLGNYYEGGDEWERPTHVQFFENDGSLAFEQNLGVRIHGAGGRHSTIKNMRMYARSEYGNALLKYKWFANDENKNFKRFLVRGPGHRPDCAPRDDLADLLVQNLNMDVQHMRHVIVFINGEYWGIHTIKERFDQKYLEGKYGKKDDDYVILRNGGILDSGEEGDEQPYTDLLAFVSENDMSSAENYNYVKQQIDMDNYLTYFTSEVYLGNVDWVDTNIKFWRYKGNGTKSTDLNGIDGKWRWFLYDFDLTFGGSCADVNPRVNMLHKAFDPDYGRSTTLATGLRQNQQFVYDFVNRMCDMLNSNFNAKNFLEKIDEIDGIMTQEMMEHVQRWRYPSVAETYADRVNEVPSLEQWNKTISELRAYPVDRKRKILDHLTAEFDLNDTIVVQANVNNTLMGNVQVNSILISEALDGANETVYPWTGTYFKNIPLTFIAQAKLGYRFVEWEETGSTEDTLVLNLEADQVLTAVFEQDPDFTFEDALFINEFMASNKQTVADTYGAYSDWLEIYNPNDKAIDLASFYISDNADKPYKYQFPKGVDSTIIAPSGFKIIWANDRTERGALHTNFKLSAAGEHIVLTAPDLTLVDEIAFGLQSEDVSFGLERDGESAWTYFNGSTGPTPGSSNNSLSTDVYSLETKVQFYPNPILQGQELRFSKKMNIKIYNSLGQLLFIGNDVSSLETSSFNKGIYFIETETIGIQKLIIN